MILWFQAKLMLWAGSSQLVKGFGQTDKLTNPYFLILLNLLFGVRIGLRWEHTFSLGPVCLAALADVVSFFNDNRSEKFEDKAQAWVHEKVFHTLFPVSVADFLEEQMQDWIRRPPSLWCFTLLF